MFSTRRRATASSSTIKMLAAMAFPARYNYLSRIGALWLMPINARLNVVALGARRRSDKNRYRLDQDDLALQVLRRRFRAADDGVRASAVLRARTQPHRRCRHRMRDADA